MRKLLFFLGIWFLFAAEVKAQSDLNKVTFGIGAGINYIFQDIYKASLTTDEIHALKLQKLSRTNFVISSIVVFKLGSLSVDADNKLITRANSAPKFWQRLSVDLAINLLEVKSDNIAFNKTVDGGIGLGCFLHETLHLGNSAKKPFYKSLLAQHDPH